MKALCLKFSLLVCMLFLIFESNGQAMRITGYFPNYYYTSTNYLNIPYNKLTHLYYFSLNPLPSSYGQSTGALWYEDSFSWFNMSRFNDVVNRARLINPAIKIMIVTGGHPGGDGDLNLRLSYIATNGGRLNTFCNNIINFIKANNLDGWDLDWEFPQTTSEKNAHESMLSKMRQKLDSMELKDCKNYEITMAVGGGYTPRSCFNPSHLDYCNASVINYVDYVNIMTYDGQVGSSSPCNFASHQHYDLMQTALSEWISDKGWPKSKIQLGVGFYNNFGTAFSSNGNNSTWYNMTYWTGGGGGCPDMQNKINYIRAQGCAGIFIWELTQDNLCSGTVPACYSLVNCIYQYSLPNGGLWTAPSVSCNLPIVLEEFSLHELGEDILLNWTTTMEVKGDFFVLQHSFDGIHFSNIDTIVVNGYPSSYQYSLFDNSGYYRLLLGAEDGSVAYSKILYTEGEKEAAMYPNPFSDKISITIPLLKGSTVIRVFNSMAVEVEVEYVKEGVSEIAMGEKWPEGIYLICISRDGKLITKRVVKE